MSPITVVAVPLLLVLPLAAYGLWSNASAQVHTVCGDNVTQEQARILMNEAIDNAFRDHIENLYSVWMKDVKGQPHRAASGIDVGVSAYVHGRNAVAAWRLKPCK